MLRLTVGGVKADKAGKGWRSLIDGEGIHVSRR